MAEILVDAVNGTGELADEVVFAFVYAVGTQAAPIDIHLGDELKQFGFAVHHIKLSDYFELHAKRRNLGLKFPKVPYDQKVNSLMDAGNKLSENQKDFAARLGTSLIYSLRRRHGNPKSNRGVAYLISSLKRPEEVTLLRQIYGSGFFLIGIYGPEHERLMHLRFHENVGEEEARKLIKRDQDEKDPSGQKTSDTFALADVYVPQDPNLYRDHLRRFIDLVFANPYVTPTKDEQCMFMAYAASLRSGDLSRQVGAALATEQGDILGVGCNDVPAPGGGLYWPGADDQRDYVRGADSNEKRRDEIIAELLSKLRNESPVNLERAAEILGQLSWGELTDVRERVISDQEMLGELASVLRNTESLQQEHAKELLMETALFSLTEFGRSVHAEMEALMATARTGRSPLGKSLYVTTFPCHNCTRHVVAAGIARVVYVEPYPKSLAFRLHWDSIMLKEHGAGGNGVNRSSGQKVLFEPFLGVGPRRYFDLFSMRLGSGSEIKRKQHRSKGETLPWSRTTALLRVRMEPTSYLERETKIIETIEPTTESV